MIRRIIFGVVFLACSSLLGSAEDKKSPHLAFDYDVARKHELKPHRRTIPLEGVHSGFNQLHLTVTVSVTGDVVDAEATGGADEMKFWPQVRDEVFRWKFKPFELNGQ